MQKTGLNKTINYCIWMLLRHVLSKEHNPSLSVQSEPIMSLPGNLYCSPQQGDRIPVMLVANEMCIHEVQLFTIIVNSHTSHPSPSQTGGALAPWKHCQKLTLPSFPLYLATGLVPLGSQCLAHLAGRGLACCHLVTNTQPSTDLDLGKQI